MNNDLISRSALLEQMHNHYEVRNPKQNATMDECCMMVIHAPAVDAETVFQQVGLMQEAFDMAKSTLVPVVRCKNCKHYHEKEGWCDKHSHFISSEGEACHPWESSDWKMFDPTDFCSYGERRADDDNS